MPCDVSGCDKPATRKRMCDTHYRRVLRNGTPDLAEKPDLVHADGTQTCSRCGERKDAAQFAPDGRLSRGRRATCKACIEATRRKRYARSSERILEVNKAWRDANPGKMREYQRTAYETHREQYLAWATDNAHKRRAILREVDHDRGITVRALRQMLGDQCCYCRKVMTFAPAVGRTYIPQKATIEHVVPLSRGGSHTWDNVRLACWKCNITKNGRLLEEWGGDLDEACRVDAPEDLDAATSRA